MIFQETYYLYFIFLSSFSLSTLVCFIQDNYYNYKYVQNLSKTQILNIYKKALPLVLLNAFITIPISLIIFQNFYFLLTPFNYYQVYHIPLFFILIDPFFYFFHYLFHNKYLYKFHKVHHQIKTPVSITSIYLHPIDLIFGNILPLFLPVFVLQSSMPLLYFWTAFTICETTYFAHSGVKGRCEDHDLHHQLFNCNYGSGIYFVDRILNTYLLKEN
jgi:sterol desaturase/sphingolipid hydroxylase (fatty acid hydroxylase superfamily)